MNKIIGTSKILSRAILANVFVFVYLNLVCCGESKAPTEGTLINQGPVIKSGKKGLLFLGEDTILSEYTLYYYEFSSGAVTQFYSGRARDTELFYDGLQYWVFERHQNAMKYYPITFDENGQPLVNEQSIEPYFIGQSGDPAAIYLDQASGDHFIALANQGEIARVKINERKVMQTFSFADFTPWHSTLRPIELLATQTEIIALNQGLQFNGVTVGENQQQSLLRIPIDSSSQAQKINLTYPNGMHAFFSDASKTSLTVLDLCPTALGSSCQNAVEFIDLTNAISTGNQTINERFQLAGGAMVDGRLGAVYFQAVDNSGNNVIMKLDTSQTDNRAAVSFLSELETTNQVAISWLDEGDGTIIFGDRFGDHQGELLMKGGVSGQFALPEIPKASIIVH